MNSKIIISITLIILLGLAAAGFLFYKNFLAPAATPQETPEEVVKETTVFKNGFSIILPVGWQEVSEASTVLMMAADMEEEATDPDLEKLGFKTNFSLKSDNLTKYPGMTSMRAYVEDIKISLVQLISGIKFTLEEEGTIDGRLAFFIECESRQRDVDFKTLLVFVEGDNQDIWAISFNTSEKQWPSYRDLFYHVAESFKLTN